MLCIHCLLPKQFKMHSFLFFFFVKYWGAGGEKNVSDTREQLFCDQEVSSLLP